MSEQSWSARQRTLILCSHPYSTATASRLLAPAECGKDAEKKDIRRKAEEYLERAEQIKKTIKERESRRLDIVLWPVARGSGNVAREWVRFAAVDLVSLLMPAPHSS